MRNKSVNSILIQQRKYHFTQAHCLENQMINVNAILHPDLYVSIPAPVKWRSLKGQWGALCFANTQQQPLNHNIIFLFTFKFTFCFTHSLLNNHNHAKSHTHSKTVHVFNFRYPYTNQKLINQTDSRPTLRRGHFLTCPLQYQFHFDFKSVFGGYHGSLTVKPC